MSLPYRDVAAQQWRYLSEITRAIAEHLDLGTVLARALRFAVELANGQAGLIALREPDGQFQFAAREAIEPDWLPTFEPLLTTVPAGLREGGRRWQFPELELTFPAVGNRQGLRLRYVMAIPLTVSRELVGVIYVFRSPLAAAFSTVDQDAFSSFADHVAVAIQNAQLYAESQRRARELESVIEGSTNALVIADADGRVRHFNRAFETLTGWPSDHAQGLTLDQVLRVRDERGELLPLPSFAGGPHPVFVVDGYLDRRNGARGPFAHVILAPLYDERGDLFSVLCSVVDLSQLKETEDMKTAFLAGISHDFKTPLALIRGYAETLRNPNVKLDPAALDSSLAIIEDEAEYLTSLVNGLLDAAQLQVGRLPLTRAPVRLDEIAASVAHRFKSIGGDRRWKLEFPQDFPSIEADPERIREVLQNLLNNAVKYSPPDSLITVGGWVEEDRVGLFVRDEGPGVPQEEQARIFGRFARGHGQATQRTRGAGLGLYLSRAIVEQHGGKLWVENMPERGATFYLTLPRTEI